VLVADGNPVLRLGLRMLLDPVPGIEVAGEAGDGPEAIALTAAQAPDVVLLDVRLPVVDGVTAAARIGRSTGVVMLTSVDEPATVLRAVAAGARGYLVHGQFDQRHLAEVVRGTAAGRSFLSPTAAAALIDQVYLGGPAAVELPAALTPREHEVMALIAEGLSNREIAGRLVISGKTVKNHVHHIYKRLNADSREHCVTVWRALAAGRGCGSTQ
jgi:DNA-binding NarL/FixJ family response regulator